VPLEWCFQPAVKLDFRHFEDGYVVTAQDVDDELVRIGHTLRPLEIVVVRAPPLLYSGPDTLTSEASEPLSPRVVDLHSPHRVKGYEHQLQ
jgi:hypothetical protein